MQALDRFYDDLQGTDMAERYTDCHGDSGSRHVTQPQAMADYLAQFDAPFIGLTGSDATIRQLADQLQYYVTWYPTPMQMKTT